MLDKIEQAINVALKRGDRTQANALRYLKSALTNARIAGNGNLTEEEALRVVRKEMKARIEARDMYANNGRNELAAKEEYERGLYAIYVPDELSLEAIKVIVTEVAAEIGSDPTFAQLMPAVMKKVAGRAGGQIVSGVVKQFIDGSI